MPGRVPSLDEPWLGTGNGLTLRSVGSNKMFLPVLFFRQEWHVVLPTCAQGSSVPDTGNFGHVSLQCLVHSGGSGFAGLHPVCVQGLGHFGVPPVGLALWAFSGGGHYLRDLWRANVAGHNTATNFSSFLFFRGWGLSGMKSHICQPQRDSPSLLGYDAFVVYRVKGHFGEFAGKNIVRPLFLLLVFLFSQNSRVRFWCLILWLLWVGRARHPGANPSCSACWC